MTRQLIDAAAWGSLLGAGGMEWLHGGDTLESELHLQVIQRAIDLDHERAKLWAGELAKALNGR